MKRTACGLILMAILGGLAGCEVTSLHPIYESADIVWEPGLVGTWVDPDDPDVRVDFGADEPGYRIRLASGDDPATSFEGHLVRIGSHLFLDAAPSPDLLEEYGAALRATHLIFSAALDGDRLSLGLLSWDWIRDLLERNPEAVAHTRLDGDILLTADTRRLQLFLAENASTPGAFEVTTLHRASRP